MVGTWLLRSLCAVSPVRTGLRSMCFVEEGRDILEHHFHFPVSHNMFVILVSFLLRLRVLHIHAPSSCDGALSFLRCVLMHPSRRDREL
jgi:hypothetical protein